MKCPMTQTTILDLANVIADALGMSRRAVEYAASDLSNNDMIGRLDELAAVEDATRLVIGVTGNFDAKPPWRAVKRFWHLPLVAIKILDECSNSITAHVTVSEDSEYVTAVRGYYGDSFGQAFLNILGDAIFLPHCTKTPSSKISLSGSPGRTSATLSFYCSEGIGMMCFDDSVSTCNEPALHGMPVASPLHTIEIPEAIFQVLNDALQDLPFSLAGSEIGDLDVYSRRPIEF